MTVRQPVALVTGAARGIGAATVLALAEARWRVVAVDSCYPDTAVRYSMPSPEDLEAVAAAGGDAVEVAVIDVRDADQLIELVARVEERWGGLDAAIACAGVIAGGVPQWELAPEAERAVLDVDLGGVLNLARAAIPALLRRPAPRQGRFLAVASAAATRGLPKLAAYCAAKAGVCGLIRALAVELAGTGVTANAVSPGSTDTAMLWRTAQLYGLSGPEEFARQAPLGRLLAPAEVAAVLTFLAGPGSSGMTGAVVAVDGGLSLCVSHPYLRLLPCVARPFRSAEGPARHGRRCMGRGRTSEPARCARRLPRRVRPDGASGAPGPAGRRRADEVAAPERSGCRGVGGAGRRPDPFCGGRGAGAAADRRRAGPSAAAARRR